MNTRCSPKLPLAETIAVGLFTIVFLTLIFEYVAPKVTEIISITSGNKR